MDYNDKLVSEIAIRYAYLMDSLRELREIKKVPNGASLASIYESYRIAVQSKDFLRASTTPELQVRLKLGELEKELQQFANTFVKI